MRIAHRLLLGALCAALAVPASAHADMTGRSSLPPAVQHAIDRTLDVFVPSAVGRHHVLRSWPLAAPTLRGGMTRAQWATGDIPVYPYKARGRTFHGWTVRYHRPNLVGLELLLHPAPHAKVGAISFQLELERHGKRWLVRSIVPAASFSPEGAVATIRAERDLQPGVTATGTTPRLSPAWIAAPVALLVLAGMLPPAIRAGLRRRRRQRAARA